MSNPLAHHAPKMAAEAVKSLRPLHEQKNEILAALLGFAFGAIGVAIYFRSAKDFFVCMAIFFGLTMLVPFGPGELLGWLFSPAYAFWRARTSNEKLGTLLR